MPIFLKDEFRIWKQNIGNLLKKKVVKIEAVGSTTLPAGLKGNVVVVFSDPSFKIRVCPSHP